MRSSLALWLQLAAAAAVVSAIPWLGPAQTSPAAAGVPQAPIYTTAPVLDRRAQLLRRDAAPQICGWIEGFLQNPYSCAGTSTCFWNTDHRVIGCGFSSSVVFQTKCVAYKDLAASCDLSCSFNPSINRCPATIPYCVNITLGSTEPYTAFACGTSSFTSYPQVQLTYTGETTLNYLPRFVDAAGAVSFGTQTPPGYTVASTSTSSPTTSPTTSSDSSKSSSASPTSSSGSSQSSTTSQSPAPQISSVTPVPGPTSSSSSSTGAIVGGVVGGVGGIAIIAGIAVFLIIRSRRKKREAGLAQNAQIASQTENKAQNPGGEPYSGSPDYQASVAPAYQNQGAYGQQQPYSQPQQGYQDPRYGPQDGFYPPQQQQHQQGLNELPGGAIPNELPATQQHFPIHSSHELQS